VTIASFQIPINLLSHNHSTEHNITVKHIKV